MTPQFDRRTITSAIAQGKALFVDGYNKEKNRMKNISLDCAHHKFLTVALFIDHIEELAHKMDVTYDVDEHAEAGQKIHDLIGVGCCKQCCVYIMANFEKITKWTARIKDTLINGKKIATRTLSPDDATHFQMFMVNCLQHPQTANFIFNQSSIWIALFNVLNVNIFNLDIQCKYEIHKRRDFASYPNETNILYAPNMLLLFQLFRNIKFIKKKHWSYILNNEDCLYPSKWFSFVTNQLTYGIYLEYDYGFSCILCFFIFICIATNYMNNKHYKLMKKKYNFGGISKWCRIVQKKLMSHHVMEQYRIVGYLLLLENNGVRKELFDNFSIFGNTVYNVKRNDMECQNKSCYVRRINQTNNKLYKCKSCRVARYCSKHCQKLDWNKNDHQSVCKRLRKSRKKNKLFWKKMNSK